MRVYARVLRKSECFRHRGQVQQGDEEGNLR